MTASAEALKTTEAAAPATLKPPLLFSNSFRGSATASVTTLPNLDGASYSTKGPQPCLASPSDAGEDASDASAAENEAQVVVAVVPFSPPPTTARAAQGGGRGEAAGAAAP